MQEPSILALWVCCLTDEHFPIAAFISLCPKHCVRNTVLRILCPDSKPQHCVQDCKLKQCVHHCELKHCVQHSKLLHAERALQAKLCDDCATHKLKSVLSVSY